MMMMAILILTTIINMAIMVITTMMMMMIEMMNMAIMVMPTMLMMRIMVMTIMMKMAIIVPYHYLMLINIMKTNSKGASGKNRIVYKLRSQPHKHQRHGKVKKSTAQRSNQQFTASLNPSSVPVPKTVYEKSFHVRTWAGMRYLANWDVLHLDTSNSNG